jgi:citronellol/citronellal dehydrogenase
MKPLIRSLPRHVPAGRLATEAEVSAAIAFLLSEAAAFISGTCVRVDGGAPNARRHWPLASGRQTKPFEGFHRGVRPRVLED